MLFKTNFDSIIHVSILSHVIVRSIPAIGIGRYKNVKCHVQLRKYKIFEYVSCVYLRIII